MWFVRMVSLHNQTFWAMIGDNRNLYLISDVRQATAFGTDTVEYVRSTVSVSYPFCLVDLVECSSDKLLTSDMLRTLNLV